MLKVTVYSPAVREQSGVSKVSGKPYSMAIQTAYVHLYERDGSQAPVPEKLDIILDKDPKTAQPVAYKPGEYQLHPSSFYMGRWGLEVAPKLMPVVKS